ncbi:elongation factor G [Brevibacillus antibioticus]|uniref:Elongation factor G n=1 Tax=Brevibacillus antibioticus TaxID=2570228 RepID=A0A4V5TJ01_9BACL|nr:elongation factor G [Brevibacillus antibioticus]TKI57343.1 elongation factor G [Brevibacillus antibioticus]
MSESKRTDRFDTMMKYVDYLDERKKLVPDVKSKYIGVTMLFPQTSQLRNKVLERIEKLKAYDQDVCIAVYFKDDGNWYDPVEYKNIIFIGNDYPHLKRIIDYMAGEEIELNINDTCILYKERLVEGTRHLKGNHSCMTSLNDLFSRVEIQLDMLEVGMGYDYENKQVNEELIHFTHSDREGDEEGKKLGYQLFTRSLDYFSREVLTKGVLLGYPVVDSKIEVINASCTMTFHREYYYLTGAHASLKSAMKTAEWQLCEPVMEIRLTCRNRYFERNSLFREVENLQVSEERDECRVTFTAKISAVIDYLEEFYQNSEDVSDIHIRIDRYVPLEDTAHVVDRFAVQYDITKWKDALNEEDERKE